MLTLRSRFSKGNRFPRKIARAITNAHFSGQKIYFGIVWNLQTWIRCISPKQKNTAYNFARTIFSPARAGTLGGLLFGAEKSKIVTIKTTCTGFVFLTERQRHSFQSIGFGMLFKLPNFILDVATLRQSLIFPARNSQSCRWRSLHCPNRKKSHIFFQQYNKRLKHRKKSFKLPPN